ncbi:MAG: hypothetical protein GX749_07195 [Ruminococcaceae bacterium]|nr:hypothetical protein [Oscillospiraceae bacterium]
MLKQIKMGIVIIISILTLNSSVYAVPIAMNANAVSTDAKEAAIYKAKIETTSKDSNVTIASIKFANDFANNKFTIIECVPKGYYIYHNDSGNFVEYSSYSISPYLGYVSNLIYAGPKEYYVEENSEYRHTFTGERLDASLKDSFAPACNDNVKRLMSSKNSKVLSYINDSTLSDKTFVSEAQDAIAASYTDKYIPNSSYLSSLSSNLGYKDGGYCGYIAANLVLYYWQKRYPSRNIVPSNYLHSSGIGLQGTGLTDELISLGSDSGTTGLSIRNVLIAYCNAHGISASSAWYLFALCIGSEIDAGRPAILFGNLAYPDGSTYRNHAVTVYGYRSSTTIEYIAHYGWPGYPNVIIAGTYGSCTSFRLT